MDFSSDEAPEQVWTRRRSRDAESPSRCVRRRVESESESEEENRDGPPLTIDEFERMQNETPAALRAHRWDTEELMGVVNQLADRWTIDRDTMLPSEMVAWACDLFQIPEADLTLSANAINVDHPNHINRKILPKIGLLGTLLELASFDTNVPCQADADLMIERLGEAGCVMTNAQDMLTRTCQLMCSLTGNNDGTDASVLSNKFLHMIQETKMTPLQSLLMDLSASLKRNGWRQFDGRYYVPITVQIGHEIYETHAWDEKDSIEQLVFAMCNCHMEHPRWLHLTSGRDIPRQTAQHLIAQGPYSYDFPTLEFDRRLFAFQDGCYDASTDIFYPHADCGLAHDRAAINYFDHPFGSPQPQPEPSACDEPHLTAAHAPVEADFMLYHLDDLAEGLEDMGFPDLRGSIRRHFMQTTQRGCEIVRWVQTLLVDLKESFTLSTLGTEIGDIQTLSRYIWRRHRQSAHESYPTPQLEGILFTQDYDLRSCTLVYAMLGKMLYEVNELDAWQTVPFIIGKGGTGKSTLLKIVRHLYPPRFVANISSNGEIKFGLSAVYGKLFWLCPEVKKNFCMDQGDFQSLVSGEEMSIAKKNETAKTVKWVSPGILCGNEVFAFEDTQESLFRRIIALYFECMVSKTSINTRLFEDMTTGDAPEFGNLLRKCNMAYRMMVEQIGERCVWDLRLVQEGIVPQTLHTFRTKFRAEIDSVVAFLEESDDIQTHARKCMSIKSLLASFKKWCSGAEGATKRGAPMNVTLLRDKLQILNYTVVLASSGTDISGYEYLDPEQHNAGCEGATGANKDVVIGIFFQPST